MKKHNWIIKLLIFSIMVSVSSPVHAEDTTALPYQKQEFPQMFQDLRRFEIITLGALPFVTLNTTLVYSGIRYVRTDYDPEYMPSLFSSSSYTESEQNLLMLTSVCICVGIGLTDYFIRLVKRSKTKKALQNISDDSITIYSLEDDSTATPIPLPDSYESVPEVTD